MGRFADLVTHRPMLLHLSKKFHLPSFELSNRVKSVIAATCLYLIASSYWVYVPIAFCQWHVHDYKCQWCVLNEALSSSAHLRGTLSFLGRENCFLDGVKGVKSQESESNGCGEEKTKSGNFVQKKKQNNLNKSIIISQDLSRGFSSVSPQWYISCAGHRGLRCDKEAIRRYSLFRVFICSQDHCLS